MPIANAKLKLNIIVRYEVQSRQSGERSASTKTFKIFSAN